MELALVGLGRMGGNMTRRLARGGHLVTAVDPAPEARQALADEAGVTTVASVAEAVDALSTPGAPRVIWLMLPAGVVTDAVLERGERSALRWRSRCRWWQCELPRLAQKGRHAQGGTYCVRGRRGVGWCVGLVRGLWADGRGIGE